jgi:hypothetical protein
MGNTAGYLDTCSGGYNYDDLPEDLPPVPAALLAKLPSSQHCLLIKYLPGLVE